MAAPNNFLVNNPNIGIGGLSPLQLAAANFLMSGSPLPFGINADFLAEMIVFGSSEIVTPLEFDTRTGLPNPYQLVRDIVGVSYYVKGEDVYLRRRALDCGPDENRFEEVLLGKVKDIASGTYAYYGRTIISGSYGTGSDYGANQGPDSPSGGNGPTVPVGPPVPAGMFGSTEIGGYPGPGVPSTPDTIDNSGGSDPVSPPE